ncbi:polysaccharide pyruvyl transferase family protein [Mariniflexile gromovii]|uniref:Polysaccharide pyruvyl transferase family protein n=1 Tax=Mariniflexile gromovii TaxID=362523 RepID=A0ABS4BQX0_9FLAO|nr:polysaccharide pyruvyl transferase family protein [Mariniflexile gromovii]MBP0902470.1 polysaccharide pyruvyl transferase family protein [Mariniflexile gromovii]
MKIKTITCHEVYNHGASLQEHALLKYLENLGHDAETIRYKPSYFDSDKFSLWEVSSPKFESNIIFKVFYILAKLPSRLIALKRKKSFDDFSSKYINATKQSYKSNEQLSKNLPYADAYICGSDQIWNSFFENGKDPAFYLDFVPDNKLKISYAASFAIDTLEDSIKKFVSEQVNKINYISVRETSGLKILAELNITDTTQVLDPVFLLPAKYWHDTFVNEISEKYILIYDFDSNPSLKKMALTLAKTNKLKIYTVNRNINYADTNFWLKGPEYFLSLLANAQFVISNSFHAVAFSLIFEKQFLVVNRLENINTRMRDLLALLNISDLLISDPNDPNISIQPISSYEPINKELEASIARSKLFLQKALNSN